MNRIDYTEYRVPIDCLTQAVCALNKAGWTVLMSHTDYLTNQVVLRIMKAKRVGN